MTTTNARPKRLHPTHGFDVLLQAVFYSLLPIYLRMVLPGFHRGHKFVLSLGCPLDVSVLLTVLFTVTFHLCLCLFQYQSPVSSGFIFECEGRVVPRFELTYQEYRRPPTILTRDEY